jgi:Fibronectin type III domain
MSARRTSAPGAPPLRLGILLVLLSLPGLPAGAAEDAALGSDRRPSAPSNLRVVAPSRTALGLDWEDNSDNETEFRLERRTLNGTYVEFSRALDPGVDVPGLEPDTIYLFRIRAENAAGLSPYSNEAVGSTQSFPETCVPDAETLCLNGGRFKLRAHWQTSQGSQGTAQTRGLTADTGTFWFFDPANVEMVVKVLNGCALNGRYWVFAGGLTNVRVIWTVTDTLLGGVKAYENPRGTAFQPLQDTGAFFTCP